mgnify:CR=1 FL=1
MLDDPFADIGAACKLAAAARRWALHGRRLWSPARIRSDRSGPPNLLVLAIDTLRADRTAAGGARRSLTPALDALGAAGAVFADVTAAAPWTLPSFSSALTGVMPSVHGAGLAGVVRDLDRQPPQSYGGAPSTLASHLSRLGWRTAAFYANPFVGFGLAETFQTRRYANLPAREVVYLALDWIRRHAQTPFFCFVLMNDPHEPTLPPRRLLAPRLAALPTRPRRAALRALARWGDPDHGTPHLGRSPWPADDATRAALAIKLALYDASVQAADAAVAEAVAQLRAWSLDRNTVVTVFSDHGEEFHDHLAASRAWGHDPRGLHGIGHGHALFQEVVRVPWVAAGPGVPAGSRVAGPVSLCDVAPTLCEWVGAEPPPLSAVRPGLAGRSQVAAAKSAVRANAGGAPRAVAQMLDEGEGSERTLLIEDIAYGPDLIAVRRGAWKLIASREGAPLALFDLAADSAEQEDLRVTRPEITAELLEAAAPLRAARPAAQAGEGWESVEDRVRRQLKQLGYSD